MSYLIFDVKKATQAEARLPQRNNNNFRYWLWLLCLLSWPGAASIAEQVRAHISAEIRQYGQGVGFPAAPKQQIELKLPAGLSGKKNCGKLQISRSNPQQAPWGRLSYTLRCQDAGQHWQSRATAKVSVWLPLVVASRSIDKDELIQPDMLSSRLTELTHSKLALALDPKPLIGMQAKKRLAAGQPISRQHLSSALLVSRGEQVLITVQSGGFSASTKGLALADGRYGERIKVQNLTSGTVIEAKVVAEATVQTILKSH
jgi:flagella basal body P-ring formation protein FlgA